MPALRLSGVEESEVISVRPRRGLGFAGSCHENRGWENSHA